VPFLKNKQYIFCFNHISFVIACEMVKNNYKQSQIIIMPNRIRKNNNDVLDVVPYSTIKALFVFMWSFFAEKTEVVIPHTNVHRRIILWIAKYSRNVSYIDDGMDTFRDIPSNIDLGLVKAGAKYYMFDYSIPVAEWLADFIIIRVCHISCLSKDIKPSVVIEGIELLVVESPGVKSKINYLVGRKCLFFQHPNHNKNMVVNKSNLTVVSGLEYCLEKTMLEYSGEVILGESMALIFAICCNLDSLRLILCLSASQYDNLSCLHSVFVKRTHLDVF